MNIYKYMCTYIRICIYIHTYIYIYVCIYVYMYICIYVNMYIYISIYLNLYLYMYMHVHPWWIKHGNGRTTISSWFLSSYKPRLPCLITGEYIYIYIKIPLEEWFIMIHWYASIFFGVSIYVMSRRSIYIYIYICLYVYIYILYFIILYYIILYYIYYVYIILYYILYYTLYYIILYYVIYIYTLYIFYIYIHTKHVYPPRSIFTAEIPGRSSPVKVAPGYHGTSRLKSRDFLGFNRISWGIVGNIWSFGIILAQPHLRQWVWITCGSEIFQSLAAVRLHHLRQWNSYQTL